jgi:hypothetical protein
MLACCQRTSNSADSVSSPSKTAKLQRLLTTQESILVRAIVEGPPDRVGKRTNPADRWSQAGSLPAWQDSGKPQPVPGDYRLPVELQTPEAEPPSCERDRGEVPMERCPCLEQPALRPSKRMQPDKRIQGSREVVKVLHEAER